MFDEGVKKTLIVIALHTYFIYMHVFEKENDEMVEWMHVAQQLFGSRDQNSSRCSEQCFVMMMFKMMMFKMMMFKMMI